MIKVMKYRTKPLVIEAMQLTDKNLGDVVDFMRENSEDNGALSISKNMSSRELSINTLEGTMKAINGDWIIRGIDGEYYPCKPDFFEQTYEPV